MREKQDWVKLRRRTLNNQMGGGHVKIDSETLNDSLDFAGIPKDVPIMVCRYACKDAKGTAKIILKIKSEKEVIKKGLNR